MDREATILAHLPQVLLVATKIHRRLPPCVLLQELVSIGTIGLIAAVDKFDPSAGVKLKSYAEYKIRGAIFDALRKLDHRSRHIRNQGKHIEAATQVLEHRLGRPPTEEEITEELGLAPEDYRKRVAANGISLVSLQDSRGWDGNPLENSVASPTPLPDAEMDASDQAATIRRAIQQLPHREQEIVRLVFWGDHTLRKIGLHKGLHETRISQLKTAALKRLRRILSEETPAGNHTPAPTTQIPLPKRAAEKRRKPAYPGKLAA